VTIATTDEPAALDTLEPSDPAPAAPLKYRLGRVRARAIRGGLLLLAFLGAVILVEIPVAQTWYHARQGQLLAEFVSPRAGLTPGHAAALLQVPGLHWNLVVVEGDSTVNLRSGPGHRPHTPLPGKRGNSIILGHRDGWGGPFRDLGSLHKGEHIVTKLRAGSPIVFAVTSVKHVSATDTRYFANTKDFRLTLVTSDGGLVSHGRLVVQAVSGTALATTHHHGPVVKVPHRSLIINWAVAIAAGAFALAALVRLYVRRHYGLAALLVVVSPIVAAGLLALVIDLDQLLPPLR
jgi:sortase A